MGEGCVISTQKAEQRLRRAVRLEISPALTLLNAESTAFSKSLLETDVAAMFKMSYITKTPWARNMPANST